MSRREALACLPKDGMEYDGDLQAWVQVEPMTDDAVIAPTETVQRESKFRSK